MKKWSIPTEQLTGPRRLGGRVSRRGFAFQDAYACLQLTHLLDDTQGVIAIRPEGAQDVDLFYTDSREEYIQIKHEPNEHYTLVALRPILQGFAVDFLEAGRASTLAFTLIARSNYIDAAVTRLRDGKPSSDDVTNVARLFAQSIKGSPAPQCLVRLSEAERLDLAVQLLQQTKFLFGMGDEIGGRLSFESHTCTELARRGIAGTELQGAFNTLKAVLDMQREFTRIDIEKLLKRFIGGASINLFEGCVEALTDELLSHPASPNRIQQFYAGAPLDWDIIAAHGDIERDQQEDLIKQLSQPSETFRLVCVVAEPGAGKSTLAWRVAAELHQRHSAFIIRIRNKENADAWYLMPDFCRRVKRPFYVLADDLFREPDVVSALRELNESLPITILATSRAHEYRPYRLKGQVERLSLKEPSLNEKERILARLGKTRNDLTPEQQRRLDAANQFLVLMMELADPKGRKLEEIVRNTVEWLQTHDESAYRAYEYLCFTYQHSLSIATSLLERLDAQGRFHNLPERDTAQGLIFNDEGYTGNIRVGHPVIAKTASVFYEEEHRAPAMVLSEIVAAVDTSNHLERRFVVHLLRVLAQAKSSALHSAFSRIEAVMASCKQKATINELGIWRAFYLNLGQHERAEECVDAALARDPVISGDCNTLLKLCRERARECDALPAIAKWVHEYPELHDARPAYLSLLERYGTRNEVEEALKETSAWLGEHSKDTSVRGRYLGLVERQGTSEQVERVLQETSAWLGVYSEDTSVRTAYLGLVERQGTSEQVERVLKETSAWLGEHSKDTSVRTAYLGLVERQGTSEQVERVLKETSAWLGEHSKDTSVRGRYLGLVERQGTSEQLERVLKETSAWLGEHSEDTSVRTAYLGLVERQGTSEQVERVLRETSTWLAQHPKNIDVRATLIGLIERKGSDKLKEAMIHDTRIWLSAHTVAKEVWRTLIAALIRLDRQQEAVETAMEAISHHPDDPNLVTLHLQFVHELADEQTVRGLFEGLITRYLGNGHFRIEFAAWLRDNNYPDEAEAYYKEQIELPQSKSTRPLRQMAHYGYGQLLLKLERYGEAEEQFRQTLRIHKGHQMAHDGLAHALHHFGSITQQEGVVIDANRCFLKAEQEFRQAIYWAGVHEQPQAIFYTHLGWFYIDRKQYSNALEAFYSAIEENPEFFGNYWGLGRALMGLERFKSAADALHMALEKAPEDFQPPASDEIPELLQQCQDLLNYSGNIANYV